MRWVIAGTELQGAVVWMREIVLAASGSMSRGRLLKCSVLHCHSHTQAGDLPGYEVSCAQLQSVRMESEPASGRTS